MNEVKEYKIGLKLASEANLEMLLFSEVEHRWIFSYSYVALEQDKKFGKPILVNDTTLVVNYDGGVSQQCELSMNITRPDKRGKEFFLGVDISKGSHLYIEFSYDKEDGLYRMKSVQMGARKRIDLDELGEGLVKQTDFPFPLKDSIRSECGVYKFPFLKNDDEIAFFEFPDNYRK